MSLKGEILYDENDDNDKRGSDGEVPALRASVGEADAGSTEGMPELQADEMGPAEPMGKVRRQKGYGFVYFAEAENGQYVKIGFSTHPEIRLSQLATKSPFPLRLVGFMPGSRHTERHLHKRFANDRANGEWFRQSAELRIFIEGMALIKPESNDDDDWQPSEELELLAWEPERDQPEPEFEDEIAEPIRPTRRRLPIAERDPIAVSLGKRRMASLTEEERVALSAKGGKGRLKTMTKAQRSASAKKAAAARWGKRDDAK